MLSVAEAQARIRDAVALTASEWVQLRDGCGRVLAADLVARRDQPPLAVSAMDGYAVRADDTEPPGRLLQVRGEVAAGGRWPGSLGPGETVRIFTGAPVPDGADAIALQENATRDGDRVRFDRACAPGEFVRPRGLDFAAGWIGLAAGAVIGPRELGLAATLGHAWLPVRRRPRVGILATGDEIRWPGEPLQPHEILSSNTTTLIAMLGAWGADPVDLGIAPDRPAPLLEAIRQARGLDMLITSGGASVGDHDLVRSALVSEQIELGFWQIAMRPGKPLLFGRLGGTVVVGLPGNPVSAGVCAIVFLRGAVRTALGLRPELAMRRVPLARPIGPNDRREEYMRGRWVEGGDGQRSVAPAERQDSSMFATFARADALVIRPAHDPGRAAGELVEVIELAEALRPLG